MAYNQHTCTELWQKRFLAKTGSVAAELPHPSRPCLCEAADSPKALGREACARARLFRAIAWILRLCDIVSLSPWACIRVCQSSKPQRCDGAASAFVPRAHSDECARLSSSARVLREMWMAGVAQPWTWAIIVATAVRPRSRGDTRVRDDRTCTGLSQPWRREAGDFAEDRFSMHRPDSCRGTWIRLRRLAIHNWTPSSESINTCTRARTCSRQASGAR